MRRFLVPSLLLATGLAIAQPAPKLGIPQGVDFGVVGIDWHPKGNAMLYTQKDGEGFAVGSYMLGQSRGATLVRYAKTDRPEFYWFAGKPNALVVIYRPSKEGTKLEVDLIDLEHQTSKKIFERSYGPKENASLDVETSPSLLHAILTLTTEKSNQHFVLKTGTFEVMPSVDLDQAAAKGISGPSWSLDGTAVYADASAEIQKRQALVEQKMKYDNATIQVLEARAATVATQESEIALKLEGAKLSLMNAENMSFRLKFVPPTPPTGATVLELMPQNATLRSVRFKGPWQDKPRPPVELFPMPQNNLLSLGRSKGQANSLWLTVPSDKGQSGQLVAAQASSGWISPTGQAVAYITDGALFIRTIGK